MSYERGWQALNLQMPDRIPHTEYVSNPAWVKRLTGLDLDDPAEAAEARVAIVREWTTTCAGSTWHTRRSHG